MKKVFFVFILSLLFLRTPFAFCESESVKTTPSLEGDEKQTLLEDTGTDAPKDEPECIEKRKKFNKLSKSAPQIYKVAMRSGVVYKLQTALGYVSTIDLPEPALKVFIGDQELFKVGVYGRQILIKPVTDYEDARTNLTVFTQSGRLSFDVTVGEPETADFVLDFRVPRDDVLVENAFKKALDEKQKAIKEEYEEKEKALESKAESIADEKLKEDIAKSTETVELDKHKETDDVRVNLLSLSNIGGKAYLRFGVRNLSETPYKISRAVIGVESYETKNLGLSKVTRGIQEIDSELKIENPVPAEAYVYGVVVFSPRPLGRRERPVFFLFDEEGKRNFKLRGFKWIP